MSLAEDLEIIKNAQKVYKDMHEVPTTPLEKKYQGLIEWVVSRLNTLPGLEDRMTTTELAETIELVAGALDEIESKCTDTLDDARRGRV